MQLGGGEGRRREQRGDDEVMRERGKARKEENEAKTNFKNTCRIKISRA